MITLERDAYTERLDELRQTSEGHMPVREFVHEDGSHTFIVYDVDPEHANPRTEDDSNVARLVLDDYCASRWRALNEPDAGIAQAVAHFDGYGRHGTTAPTWGIGETSRRDSEYMVRRYLSIFRPDVAHYDEWQVNGSSQSDWQGGYGYVLAEDAERIAVVPDPKYTHDYNRAHPRSRRFREVAKEAFDQEVKVYGLYFAGEVFSGIHVKRGKPIVTYGEQGAYVDGYEADEESVGGFLGYDNLRDICGEFTASPVVEERWI